MKAENDGLLRLLRSRLQPPFISNLLWARFGNNRVYLRPSTSHPQSRLHVFALSFRFISEFAECLCVDKD